MAKLVTEEISLDPEDWDSFRSLAHEMVDDMIDHLASLSSRPVWQQAPANVCHAIQEEPLPRKGLGDVAAYRDFQNLVLPYSNGNLHPRFFGWAQGNGTPLAMMADMLASGLNPHMGGFNQTPKLVEFKVVDWVKELLGFPANASGVLASGGSMGNLTALMVARNARAGAGFRNSGHQQSLERLTVYGSDETHGWIYKATELMGLGVDAFRSVATKPDYTIDLGALAECVAKDREAGLTPFCVIASAGTINTGAIDDMGAIADFCAANALWLHVDGAIGALAFASESLHDRMIGLDRADSIAVDLHKWMYLPFEVACVLVRDAEAHKATFSKDVSYLATLDRGVAAGGMQQAGLCYELTRSFKALKAWMCMKAYGVDRILAVIEQNVRQAEVLCQMIADQPELELMAPVSLNIVCFRFRPASIDEKQLDGINLELLLRLQERGLAAPSSTTLGGRFAIRVAFVNHRTRLEDVHSLVKDVLELGRDIVEETRQ